MSNVVNFNLRLEKDLKEQVGVIFENYGMTTAQALRMFLVNVAKTKKVPLSLDYQSAESVTPNAETAQAIRQGRADYLAGKLEGYPAEQALAKLQEIARG